MELIFENGKLSKLTRPESTVIRYANNLMLITFFVCVCVVCVYNNETVNVMSTSS